MTSTNQPMSYIYRYNRILDLERFRKMTTDGRIPADNFVTISVDAHTNDISLIGSMGTEADVVKYFDDFSHKQVSTK